MNSYQTNARRAGGFSLLELSIVLSITVVVFGALGTALGTAQAAYNETVVTANTDEVARRVLDRVVDELRGADLASVSLSQTTDASLVNFASVSGWNGSSSITGSIQTVSFVAGTVLLNGVPVAGGVKDLNFNLNGTVLTIAVEIENTVTVNGESRVVARRLTANLSL